MVEWLVGVWCRHSCAVPFINHSTPSVASKLGMAVILEVILWLVRIWSWEICGRFVGLQTHLSAHRVRVALVCKLLLVIGSRSWRNASLLFGAVVD